MKSFVAAVLPNSVSVENAPAGLAEELRELRCEREGKTTHFRYSSEPELASLLTKLQSLRIPFVAAGSGWHPAAVFEDLRGRGLVGGRIATIVWSGPSESALGEA